MTSSHDELATRVRALQSEGRGDAEGLALVGTLLARAGELPASGRARLVARAEALLATYEARAVASFVPRPPVREDAWRERLERPARPRAPRPPIEAERGARLVAEIRAEAATARAAEHVPAAAGPYHGAAVAARALDELVAIAPAYLGSYIAWLEDLACLAELAESNHRHRVDRVRASAPERRPSRKSKEDRGGADRKRTPGK